ncbi:MAG: glycosyltransferase family 8 protein [Prevotella sp.]|nr:glycosyltransferase family 8 protein [Prevotella sp.]MDY4040096.1 glycosyltransferase family 8 protein [Prevotella sp.]
MLNRTDSIHVVCATDDGYVMPTGIMLTSLFENNQAERLSVHVLTGGLSLRSKEQLMSIADSYNQQLSLYTISEDMVKHCPINNAWQQPHVISLATYYRLFMTDLLPQTISRVIYLDGDMIVRHSLRPLWETDFENASIAVVPDQTCHISKPYNRLHYPQSLGYFNGGMLVVNLAKWRTTHLADRFAPYIKENWHKLRCHEQDVLNFLLCNDKKILPLRWNAMEDTFLKPDCRMISWELDAEVEEAQRDPAIVHFTGSIKPWHRECHHPYQPDFMRYESLSPWKGQRHRFSRGRYARFKLALLYALSELHLVVPPPTYNYFRNRMPENNSFEEIRPAIKDDVL